MSHSSQFGLLAQRRFAPFFWTQFCGAANDNLFKFSFTVMATWQLGAAWLPPDMAGLVIGAVFILPFLLLSATSGQLADKFDKRALIVWIKRLEVAVMLLAAVGFWRHDAALLLGCVFLMGVHSTLFGPVKYAYLPCHLHESELTGGNGMVEMGTFVAILLGSVAGGLLVALPDHGPQYAALACLALALLGLAASHGVPPTPAAAPQLRICWNPVAETWRNLALARQQWPVFMALIGISWMWFFGAVFLANFPAFAKESLHGSEQVAALLLTVFSVGIGAGSLWCEKLSQGHVEPGLAPLGAIGMSVFSIDLYAAVQALPAVADGTALSVAEFVARPGHWRVMADLALLSFSAGIYSVPLYALIQAQAAPERRARVIAANNILNALFMIAASVLAALLLRAGLSTQALFAAVGLVNVLAALYAVRTAPGLLLRLAAKLIARLTYRFQVRGMEHVPATGPALLVANHVSFIDPVLIMAACPRDVRFIMDSRIFRAPGLGLVFRMARAIPIAPHHEEPLVYHAAFEQAVRALQAGEVVCIFPEGGITRDGQLQPFKGGIMKILARAREQGLADVPVAPLGLSNLWGSFFSRIEKAGAMTRPFRRGVFNRVALRAGPPVSGDATSPRELQARVQALID